MDTIEKQALAEQAYHKALQNEFDYGVLHAMGACHHAGNSWLLADWRSARSMVANAGAAAITCPEIFICYLT